MNTFAQSNDSIQLKYPIYDRNESFINQNSNKNNLDLKDPKAITQEVKYDLNTGKYVLYEKIGDNYYKTPTYMTFDEYMAYMKQKSEEDYFSQRSRAIDMAERKSKQPFLYQGPELFDRGFGGTKIEIKPQGTVEVTVGVNSQRIDNPVLLENQRRNINFDFDMNIQLGLQASIGDKLKLGINYNTQAGFSFDNQLKLAYEGKEDDIIKSLEFGNVSMPLRSALIRGPQSLFGVKTKLQFGRLTITNILSQQKSKTENIRVENGAQTKNFEIKADEYEENRHFFLSHYFRDTYEQNLAKTPFVASQVVINRLEVWVTNKTRQTTNVREVVAFADLGENNVNNVYNPAVINGNANPYPDNKSNNIYSILTQNSEQFRDPARTINFLTANGFQSIDDYEKVGARKLSESEYTFNPQLGYISLNLQLRPDEVLGIAMQYTVNGQVYQVGEFGNDLPPLADSTASEDRVLALKMLKATSIRVQNPIWDLMMKNIYSLGAYNVSDEMFLFDIYYKDPGGGFKRYLPDAGAISGKQLIKVVGLDRLNTQGDPYPDGRFDFLPGITITPQNGKIIFPVLEPFGKTLSNAINDPSIAAKYAYQYLYDTTKVGAQQFPEFNRYVMKGSYRGVDNSTFRLPGAFNLPQGSVIVRAGGNVLTENVQYTVNYGIGEINIIDQGILNSGLPIDISFENNLLFGVVNKSLLGTRLDYAVSKNFNIGFTHLRLAEKPFTNKVNIGNDPVRNNVLGLDLNYQGESKGLTKFFNKITAQDLTSPSKIQVMAEVAKFIPGSSKAINIDDQGTVYLDDFEGASTVYDVRGSFLSWQLSSAPKGMPDIYGMEKFPEAKLSDSLSYGFNRAKTSWYTIDPIFYNSNNTNPLDGAAIQAARDNRYTRQYLENDIFQNKQNDLVTNPPIATLDVAYFPEERGSYNYDAAPSPYSSGVDANGKLKDPSTRWGGIMRTIETSDFEAVNVEYIQMWVLDPFQYPGADRKGNLYIQLGNISEDILKDSRKQYENGLPKPNGGTTVDTSAWGVTPSIPNAITNYFDADPDVVRAQDVGLDGLDDDKERDFYATYLSSLSSLLTPTALDEAIADPSSDNYVFPRDDIFGSSTDLVTRYSKFSLSQGNSSNNLNNSSVNGNSKTFPDNEDLNNDNTLNENDEYYQYRIAFDQDFLTSSNFVTDRVPVTYEANGGIDTAYWYQFKIPIKEFESRVGNISDFRSIRFMRMVMTDFEQPVVFRFAQIGLIRNQWRRYDFSLLSSGEQVTNDNFDDTEFNVVSVNVEENSSRSPIPYAVPPGINREQNVNGVNNALQNEQSLALQICKLNDGDARAIYKVSDLDLRNYKRIKLFTHVENFVGGEGSAYPVNDNDLSVFIRIGADFTENYYEYELPLQVTPPGNYNPNSDADRAIIWPDSNELNIVIDSLTKIKEQRNKDNVNILVPYRVTNANKSTITVIGNPDIGNASLIMIGVRNPRRQEGVNAEYDDGLPKCAEVWINELRLSGLDETSGWAALGRVDFQLGNLGNITMSGNMHTIGYGDLEQRVDERYRDNYYQVDVAANLNLGNLLPEKAGLQIPVYAQYSQAVSTPQYDPYEFDTKLKHKFDEINADSDLSKSEKKDKIDSIKNVVQEVTTIKSVNVTNLQKVRTNAEKTARVYDVENFSFSYAYTQTEKQSPILEYETITRHRGSVGYNFSPKSVIWQPFKSIKNNSQYLKFIKEFNLNLKPNALAFRTDLNRQFGETKIRDIGDDGLVIDPTFDKYFTWDRFWSIKYNITKSINVDFTANNASRIDEPYGKLDTKEKRDSMWGNFLKFGRPINYNHIFNASYNLPLKSIPFLDWITVRTRYGATYDWTAASLVVPELGSMAQNSMDYQINAEVNFQELYKKANFLKPYANNQPKKSKEDYQQQLENHLKKEEDFKTKMYNKEQDIEKKIQEIEAAKIDTNFTKDDIDKLVDEKKKLKNDYRSLKMSKRNMTAPANPKLDAVLRPLMMIQRASLSFDRNYTTVLPGLMPAPLLFGQNFSQRAPGGAFLFGAQKDTNWLNTIASKGWISGDTTLNYQFIQTKQKAFNLRVSLEPFRDFRVEVSMQKTQGETYTEFFKKLSADGDYQHLTPQVNGNYSISFLMFRTLFGKIDDNNFSKAFRSFETLRTEYSQKFGDRNPNSTGIYINDSISLPNYAEGYGPYSQDVLLPALLAAYTGKNPDKVKLNPLKAFPLPNWRLTYNGIAKTSWGKKLFTSFNIKHGYNSTFSIGSYITNLNYIGTPGYFNEELYYVPENLDSLSGNYYALYAIPQITITEQLSPLIGVDITWKNTLITNFEFKKARTVGLSMLDYRLSENLTTEITASLGYKIANFKVPFKIKGKKITLDNDINLRADFSIRNDKTIAYKLDQNIAEPVNGQKTITLSTTMDYVVNQKLNVRVFYDFRRITPAVMSSYPSRTHRGGITFRFSLTP
ncbi:MAG: cell surface protein SprA [Chitinophagales bacterium]|nr:cell surface protein SprA [Chitinophagales bacterium]